MTENFLNIKNAQILVLEFLISKNSKIEVLSTKNWNIDSKGAKYLEYAILWPERFPNSFKQRFTDFSQVATILGLSGKYLNMDSKAIYRALGNDIFIENLDKAMQKAKPTEKKRVFWI